MAPARPEAVPPDAGPQGPVARLDGVTLRYGRAVALDDITVDIPAGRMVGLIGPDGVGKSSLLALITGVRAVQQGRVQVLGGDMASARHRRRVCPEIAYMPQGLGRNLYQTLSVEENLQFFGRLFGRSAADRRWRIDELTAATGLGPFLRRPAGQLSGGMKQKLGLCCALIHDPALLVLDEPTTGVDPLSRRQFWELIGDIRQTLPGLSVVVATAYMDEAGRFDHLIAMNGGRVLAAAPPAQLYARTGETTLDAAFIALLPPEQRRGHQAVVIPPLPQDGDGPPAIRAEDLTMRFGDFVAVDGVSFSIERGEIFGFLGSNGCGKTTTMKMLTGLLPPSSGTAQLFGRAVDPRDLAIRRRVGYMTQGFSLYTELTVGQNLCLHARLFHVPEADIPARVAQLLERFELRGAVDRLPGTLPLGHRQRLSLAVAVVHQPEILILDEPTSGVDPVARDGFWQLLSDLSRQDRVTIFVSTHFMNEGERCDRIALMHAGRVLMQGPPAQIVRQRGAVTLEDAFIDCLQQAQGGAPGPSLAAPRLAMLPAAKASSGAGRDPDAGSSPMAPAGPPAQRRPPAWFSWRRALSYSQREALELLRDPVRAGMALLGGVLLLFVMSYGISMDVENLTFAVLDRDQTGISRNYAINLGGSRYFTRQADITDYDDLDRRMRSSDLALAIEIPPGFARHLQHGDPVEIAAWVDGAMPQRADTIRGYVQGMHQLWLLNQARERLGRSLAPAVDVETRFRYNPDVLSLPAIVPAVVPMLLLLIPAMLTALSVVREKELGSIINFRATPVTRAEFLLGKQLPYVLLGMVNFLVLTGISIVTFGVPLKGNFPTLAAATLVYVVFATGFGLFCSTFTRSQIAAIFVTLLFSILPAVEFSGLLNPVSSLDGFGELIGRLYPMSYMLTISRGVFSKALGFADLKTAFLPLLVAAPLIVGASMLLLGKQER